MQVQVLGYWGTYPEAGEATTGFLIEDDGRKILLDCGSGVLSQLFKVASLAELDAVVITHHHHDHVADLGVLSYSLLLARLQQSRSTPLPIFLPRVDTPAVRDLQDEPMANVRWIDDASIVKVGDTTLRFVRTSHPVYCLAPRFESAGKSLVFSADSSWNEDLLQHAEGADLFLCEASMYAGMEQQAKDAGHLTSRQAGEMAARSQVKQLAITHYPHYGDLDLLVSEAAAAFGKPVVRVGTLSTLSL